MQFDSPFLRKINNCFTTVKEDGYDSETNVRPTTKSAWFSTKKKNVFKHCTLVKSIINMPNESWIPKNKIKIGSFS